MGKRKKSGRSAPAKKKAEGLPTIFSCLFCNHEHSVHVKMDKKAGIGQLQCKVCGQTFQTDINYLSAPVDVYYDWVDAADQVAEDHKEGRLGNVERVAPSSLAKARPTTGEGGRNTYVEKDRDDFVVDDEGDGEGAFAIDDDDDED